MDENKDILCTLPRGGPPTADGELHQGTTFYKKMSCVMSIFQEFHQSTLLNPSQEIPQFTSHETALVIMERTF